MKMRVDDMLEALRHEPDDLRLELLQVQCDLHREIKVLGLRLDNLNVILRATTQACSRRRADETEWANLHDELRKMGETENPEALLIEHIIKMPELPHDSSAY